MQIQSIIGLASHLSTALPPLGKTVISEAIRINTYVLSMSATLISLQVGKKFYLKLRSRFKNDEHPVGTHSITHKEVALAGILAFAVQYEVHRLTTAPMLKVTSHLIVTGPVMFFLGCKNP